MHKKKITFAYGIENDSMVVTASKDGAAKVFSLSPFAQKKILFAKDTGVCCGTPYRSEKIIAVLITWIYD
jgi:hypothetical protein